MVEMEKELQKRKRKDFRSITRRNHAELKCEKEIAIIFWILVVSFIFGL